MISRTKHLAVHMLSIMRNAIMFGWQAHKFSESFSEKDTHTLILG